MYNKFKQKYSFIGSIWLLLLIIASICTGFVDSASAKIILLTASASAIIILPLVFELTRQREIDELQLHFSRFSSHIGFHTFLILVILIMIAKYIRFGEKPPAEFQVLLIVPLMTKFIFNTFSAYSSAKAARIVSGIVLSLWFALFLISSNSFADAMIYTTIFGILFLIELISFKFPKISGVLFIALGIFIMYLFPDIAALVHFLEFKTSRLNLFLWGITFYSVLPLPILISGIFFLIPKREA